MTNSELKQIAIELVGEEELSRRFRLWITGLIKKEREKRSDSAPDALFLNEATSIVNDLNKRTGRRYTLNPEAKKMIKVILAAGHSAEDFFKVHEVMVKRWVDDPVWKNYLQPSTLWQLKKFDERLACWVPKEEKKVVVPNSGTNGQTHRSAPTEDNSAIIAKLMAIAWDGFDTWAEFMRWTIKFPDPKSLEKYPMPEQIRKMRTAPSMVMNVLKGQSPEWAEKEYKQIKGAK